MITKGRRQSKNVVNAKRVRLKGTSQYLGGMDRAAKRDAKEVKQANQYKQALKSYPLSPEKRAKEMGKTLDRLDTAVKKARNNNQRAMMKRRRRMP